MPLVVYLTISSRCVVVKVILFQQDFDTKKVLSIFKLHKWHIKAIPFLKADLLTSSVPAYCLGRINTNNNGRLY